MTDLTQEFSDAVRNVSEDELAALFAAGVPEEALQPSPVFGLVTFQAHGSTYKPVDEGVLAVIVPCGFWDGLDWQLDDLCAFYLDKPERWWLRLGVGVLLGDIHRTSLSPRRIYQTPLQWLQGGATGFCILDWVADPVDLLIGVGDLIADRSLLNRLRKSTIQAATARLDRVVCYG
jgi:hypothetical protein